MTSTTALMRRLRYRLGIPFIVSVVVGVVTTAWPFVTALSSTTKGGHQSGRLQCWRLSQQSSCCSLVAVIAISLSQSRLCLPSSVYVLFV